MEFRFAVRFFAVVGCFLFCVSSSAAGENQEVRSSNTLFTQMFQGSDPPDRTSSASQIAQLSFPDMKTAYYAGDTFTISVNISAAPQSSACDLYMAIALNGAPTLVFLTGNDAAPFSWSPVPARSGIPVASDKYTIFSFPIPSNFSGMGFYLYAALLKAAQPLSDDALISNIPTLSVKFLKTPEDAKDMKQAYAIDVLKTLSGASQLEGRLNQGVVRKLDLEIYLDKSALGKDPSMDDLALGLMMASEDLLRVPFPMKNLRLIRRTGDKLVKYHFAQYYQDIPVYGSWYKMVLKEEPKRFVLQSIAGRYSPSISLPTMTPEVSSQKALNVVLKSEGLRSLSELEIFVPPKLWIFDEALLASECPKCPVVAHNPRLAWGVVYNSPLAQGAATDAFVDALSGAILFKQPRTDASMQLNSFTAEGNTSRTCFAWQATRRTQWHDEEGECDYSTRCRYYNYCPLEGIACVNPSAEGYDNFDWSNDLYAFYRDIFGRRSYDGHDSYIWMYLDVGFSPANASSTDCGAWTIHQFSNGMHAIDVVGHEFGHSVHDSETNFVYQNESGGVAEHVADMFGHFFACWVGVGCNWRQGESTVRATAAGCGRDLSDPTRCSDPDHYTNYLVTSGDRGGVHTNCGILNKAGYLMTEGGTHNSITVTGIGEAKARQVYYRAVTHEMGRNTGFQDFATDMADACSDLISGGTVSSADCCQVRNAFAAVGLGLADQDCDGIFNDADTDDDGDLIPDAVDNCIFVANSSQTDTDSDGMGDACDPDIDNDTIPNDVDNCRYRANAGQQDFNGDGQGDACDDTDGDGIWDSVDNCRSTHNRDQADVDGDGQGDACDADIDNDGVANDRDNCIFAVNATQVDTDRDGIGDACDNCVNTANFDQDDIDGDGLGNACDNDIDGDGIVNANDECPEEYTYTSEWTICPTGAICRWGCNPDFPPPFDPAPATWRFGLDELDPMNPAAMRPVLVFPFDPCNFVPCEAQTLFPEGTSVNVSVNLNLDLSGEKATGQAMFFHAAVVDARGNRLGEGQAVFDNNELKPQAATGAQVFPISFPILPSYTWREAGKYVPSNLSQAALPAYYLIVTPALAGVEQQKILSRLPLTMALSVSVEQKQK